MAKRTAGAISANTVVSRLHGTIATAINDACSAARATKNGVVAVRITQQEGRRRASCGAALPRSGIFPQQERTDRRGETAASGAIGRPVMRQTDRMTGNPVCDARLAVTQNAISNNISRRKNIGLFYHPA